MRWYKADMHIHTVLSPCGGLDMSPVNIVRQAAEKKLDIIAITDHNSTRHCRVTRQIGEKYGITILPGAEVNTKEDIHCLTFFENESKAEKFQLYIDANLTVIRNNPDIFGYQYIVDEQENILEEEDRLLISSIQRGIEEVQEEVYRLGGIFVPAHINRMHNGIYGHLGFLPGSLKADALEVLCVEGYRDFLRTHPETGNYSLIAGSDAHTLEQIGASTTDFFIASPDFVEIRQALHHENQRKVGSL
jgi:PHP family Zn ribbon phosphoesterase